MYQPSDRRPIASRDRRVWIALAQLLVNARVSANSVSIAGMIFGIFCGATFYLSAQNSHWRVFLVIAAAFCQLRLLCNMLDGMVAIHTGQASRSGELFNEIPDRISDSFALIGFGAIQGSSWTLGLIAALSAMFTAYIRAVGKCAGAPQAFHGPMAKPQRMFLITVAAVYLAFAPMSAQPMLWRGYGVASVVLAVIIAGCAITVLRRLNAIAGALKSAD